ncbi:PREDICTED: hsp70-binding protein 1 [Pseudopodoces humilis]|uniref:hsp70-binding protein 1 n=1 Tax=Pseudopodoces humilis TaxID=181119 RepID=UPI0006B84F5D|nr:PREDICTED: hsp70-binding protein 1 [Pseudopodoces humilis]
MAVVAGEARPEPREPISEERQRWLHAAVTEALGSTGTARAQLRRCLRALGRPEPEPEPGKPGHPEQPELEHTEPEPGHTRPGHPEQPELEQPELDPELAQQALAELAELCESLDNAIGLVRAQPQGLQQLEALGGLGVLGELLGSPQPPLRARAAFLLHCLLREHPRLTEPLLSQGSVPRAAALLRSRHDGAHEHGLGTLWALASGSPEGLRQCRDPALGLEPLLRERRRILRGLEQFQEELEFCERLLQLCFPEESAMDR